MQKFFEHICEVWTELSGEKIQLQSIQSTWNDTQDMSKFIQKISDDSGILPEILETMWQDDSVSKNKKMNFSYDEKYTDECLRAHYQAWKQYALICDNMRSGGIISRIPNFEENISENIIKRILIKFAGMKNVRWKCNNLGDLSYEGSAIECKAFISDGPSSFSPTPNWNRLVFLDARGWRNDHFILYLVSLTSKDEAWNNIKVNSTETFQQQCKDGRRPRIEWDKIRPQIEGKYSVIFDGRFEDIFC